MSVQSQVMEQMKAAMKSKDTVALESLRALKSAFFIRIVLEKLFDESTFGMLFILLHETKKVNIYT
jgi:uncharacterized protein YqeY